MKKFSAYLIAITSAIFLFAQNALASVYSGAIALGMQTKYGPSMPPVQALYGVMPPTQDLYGPMPFGEVVPWYDFLHNPLWRNPKILAIAIVPIALVIGTTVLLFAKRKNRAKTDGKNFKKNNQDRRA